MLKYALMVFFVGALGGLFLASFVLRGRLAPWAVSLLHALLGASGLALLLLGVVDAEGGALAIAALCVLLVAAGFGFYLATIHYNKTVAIKRVVLAHAGVAVTGVGLLIAAILMS
ncbi:hypothetical protein H9L17_08515 [Thermomonas brevis]|uniref:Uncharacterized protein n=1 Tax=Thermomonas brevis TaxID=215691 RepID=A0A7G9QPK8_9GAMM|nr:hypothetical protein [Thermomonas brevis]QNN45283.1 hypothetical protein H9L17_08515 [Thermomonas brevis]